MEEKIKIINGSQWFVNYSNNVDSDIRIFCFPHAGGSANVFYSWSKYIPEYMELIALELPGRGSRFSENPINKMDILINNLTDVIINFLDKPYIVFGHSLGSYIGFELVKTLRRFGKPLPFYLFLASQEGPRVLSDNKKYNLSDREFIKFLEGESINSSQMFENKEIFELLIPMLRADHELADTYHEYYKKEDPLSCPITVFSGKDDKNIKIDDLEDWRMETSNIFNVDYFQGDHYFIYYRQLEIIQTILKYIFK